MRTMSWRMTLAALVALGVATGAAAQGEPEILNRLEVQRLAASLDPEDQAQLSRHFFALSERFSAEAAAHRRSARAALGNPNRRLAFDAGAHASRLAESAAASATLVRGLARHYGRLAVGVRSTAAIKAAPFQGGAGAPAPTAAELRQLALRARALSDHGVLEEYYAGLAEAHLARADEHAAMAGRYRVHPRPRAAADPAVMCDRVVNRSRRQADRALAMAFVHRQFAGVE